MASDSDSLSPIPENGRIFDWTEEEREENKRLRNAGLEYISRTGRTVAAKKQPGKLIIVETLINILYTNLAFVLSQMSDTRTLQPKVTKHFCFYLYHCLYRI